ncbi:MarR family winged helix-turn-helix transcriptional regulator [Conexibacter arvalis]|uniref:DNA-binding MarR family transcriptional regulator n=1 Tax=Conexibacter arvalis TaxID=912552 RepID=A0A840I9K5_9ACTN|nr:MarR family transcriptional regulator [Conexibacter arvalis]MBB4660778.1 DNA-binding MarR family transcriptional regulator [Conexibacter arvalis]
MATARTTPHSVSALLDHLARLSRVHTEATLDARGLRQRHLVALTVLREHAPATQQALASALAIDRTNLVGLLNELEGDGYVERRRSAEDRRRHIVELTPAGERALTGAEQAIEQAEAEIFHGLSEQERATLRALLQRATAGHVLDCAAAAGLRDPVETARDEDEGAVPAA